MNLALSFQEFSLLGCESRVVELFDVPIGNINVFVSNHFELGVSELVHYHDDPHLALIVNGGVIDKRKLRETELVSGDLMFFCAGESHQTINKAFPTKYVSLTFDSTFFSQNRISEINLETSIKNNLCSKFTIMKIYKELSIKDEFSNRSIEMLLFNLIDGKNVVKSLRPAWVNKVYQLLNDNWNREISLMDLAISADVHPKTVSRYFPKYFACTLGEYRRKLKVEKSLAMIKTSKLTLTEIAYECNFSDQSHFIRDFKRMTGFLPKEFKRL